MRVSIIIRAKNEERWITSCLNAVFKQSFKDFEVIILDNKSTDKTVPKARQFNVKIVDIEDYPPGKALNYGVRLSRGEFLAFLSAHCIPKNDCWLQNLLRNFNDDGIAGVYGRQEPLNFTDDFDKRDLNIIFGFDRRIQIKDSFFHNANSMIRRDVWEKFPFDEKITNIEDRLWGQQVINAGYKIVYEPEAAVFHYHGIHQSMNEHRCKSIVEILESFVENKFENSIDPKNINVVAIIPVKGEMEYFLGEPLIKYTIERAKKSNLIDKLVVSTDNLEIIEYSKKMGVDITILRHPILSRGNIGIERVLQYTLERLEDDLNILPDIILHLGVQSVFRPKGIIDELIKLLCRTGFDSVLPGFPTYKSCWINDNNTIKRMDEGFLPKQIKKPIHVGYPGLACVTMPGFIREGRLLGDKVEILEIKDLYSTIEIKDKASLSLAEKIFPEWQKENYE